MDNSKLGPPQLAQYGSAATATPAAAKKNKKKRGRESGRKMTAKESEFIRRQQKKRDGGVFVDNQCRKKMKSLVEEHDKLIREAAVQMKGYQKGLGSNHLAGLTVVRPDGRLPVVVVDRSCRMPPEVVASVLKTTFSEKGSCLFRRNSQSLGLANSSFELREGDVDGPILAIVLRDVFSMQEARATYAIYDGHKVKSVGWMKGCEADPRPTSSTMAASLETHAMDGAGLRSTNVKEVLHIGSTAKNKAAAGCRIKYKNPDGEIKDRPFSSHINRHTWATSGKNTLLNNVAQDSLPLVRGYISKLESEYMKHITPYMLSRGWPLEEIDLEGIRASIEMSTLEVTAAKNIAIHRDPPTPTFAAVSGHGMSEVVDNKFVRSHKGGNLFLADGMFRLDYSGRDLVLLDGNVAHGVSDIRRGQNGSGEPARFSMITFSRWMREAMKMPGKYTGHYQK
ncbi:hypothetical protein ACHAXT_008176 [Thalassiosira profunda]